MRPSIATPSPVPELAEARRTTLTHLIEVDDKALLSLTQLTLPEIREIQREIAHVLPAGNLPAFILSGLIQLKKRRLTPERVQKDLNALFQGLDLLPRGLYGLLVAGPAAVLYTYQKLLRLTGRDLESAFPEGTWQFYLEFGLREDTARHTNETLGFHRSLRSGADDIPMAAAWLLSAVELLHRYDDLLAVDWREHVMLHILHQVTAGDDEVATLSLRDLMREWGERCPYHRPARDVDYLRYRLETFERFVQPMLDTLPEEMRRRVRRRYTERQQEALAAYQTQMSLLAALRPLRHREERVPLPLWKAAVGFIWQGRTYLLPACDRDNEGRLLCVPPERNASPVPLTVDGEGLRDPQGRSVRVDGSGRVQSQGGQYLGVLRPPSPSQVLGWVRSLFEQPAGGEASTLDLLLAATPRAEQEQIRAHLPQAAQAALSELRCAPVLINWDLRPFTRPLAQIRRAHRGIGDHALTIFHTEHSMVFDQSHIFFDGLWGMAVAEILTDGAIHAHRRLEEVSPSPVVSVSALDLTVPPATLSQIRRHVRETEAAAESTGIDLPQISRLRRWLKQRGVKLTVNDLLLLYRFFHTVEYRISPEVRQALSDLEMRGRREIRETIDATLERLRETNPALLIPMDAGYVSPRERIYPTTFRNPLTEISALYAGVQARYLAYRHSFHAADWEAFDAARRDLLAYLKAFGEVLEALKSVTMRGESFNTATLRLLAHLPPAMQHLLDDIPQQIGVLNEVLKGSEVFSNVGRVAPGSTLHRFISAKDDGAAKELVWGVLTDDHGVVHVSLRDFRPFVSLLLERGEDRLAQMLAEDYLDSYVEGFNRFVAHLSKIAAVKKR